MRQTTLIRTAVLSFLALAFMLGNAFADARSEAKSHYQAGVKAYNAADYKSAIREFSTAQSLAPADLNNYNLALCYDKLGDPEPAIQYYRAYLDKVPNTDKRAEIEASVARLDAASKSVAKKAEDARKAEDAKKAEAGKKPVGPPVGPVGPAGPETPTGPEKLGPEKPAGPDRAPDGVGSTGTPGGPTVSTGDSQLDRVASIDVNQVRDQRVGGRSSGLTDQRSGGPATAQAGATAGASQAPPPAGGPNAAPAAPVDQPKKATPVYKKWWFWAVVAVSAYVVYSIASDNSSSDQPTTRGLVLPNGPAPRAATGGGGLTLMSW